MKDKPLLVFIFILSSIYSNAQEKIKANFSLDCYLKNDLTGYVFLESEDEIIDSSLVTNNHFSFTGILEKPIVGASLIMKDRGTSNSKRIYLENAQMEVNISTTVKKMRDGMLLTIFELDTIKGSITERIREDYNLFEKQHKHDHDFYQKSIIKLNDIVNKNPNNPYAGDLLSNFSMNEKYSKEELKKIYSKIQKEYQGEFSIKFIEKNLFPEMQVDVNDLVYNFQLPDKNEKIFDTKSLSGKWYLIDFWASWCGPCREQIPDLKKVYEIYKNKNFEVVAISIDKDKKNWIDALEKENLSWINVNENKHFYGQIVKRYNVYGIPSNFLINPEGKIVSKKITMEELEKILKERK